MLRILHPARKGIKIMVLVLLFYWVYVLVSTKRTVYSYSDALIEVVIYSISLGLIAYLASKGLRWHEATADGIVLHFISGRKKLYAWDDFCFVGMMELETTQKSREKLLVCSTEPVLSDTIKWCRKHHKTVLFFAFTADWIDDFAKICPREIEGYIAPEEKA